MLDKDSSIAESFGVNFKKGELTRDTYEQLLKESGLADTKNPQDSFFVNLTVDVDSKTMIEWCQKRNVRYVDTVSFRRQSMPLSICWDYILNIFLTNYSFSVRSIDDR
jgi:homospermidine synthase